MARRRSILGSLGEVDEQADASSSANPTKEGQQSETAANTVPAQAAAPAVEAPAAPVEQPAESRPTKRRSAPRKSTRGEGSTAGGSRSGSASGRGSSTAKAATKKPAAGGSSRSSSSSSKAEPAPGPHVLIPTTAESKRVGLYLHPDDYRELGLAKLDDGADSNARVRAMIALWRSNERFRNAVDKLARTSPRGPGRG
ncbi:hypothetical protein ACL02T_29960 [Pseudonocardia sp. RS010]|uniref:hypothetical protein n=1 Tax=Pseudonocardia sp. RS010 TaxID=3385979 RepID=UPI0039A0A357